MFPLVVQILLLLLLICLNGFLAAAEISLVSARRIRLEQQAELGNQSAARAVNLIDESGRFLSTVQVGITLIGIVVGAIGGSAIAAQLAPYFETLPLVGINAEAVSLALVIVVSTYLSLVIGELVPKRIALSNPDKTAVIVATPMYFLGKLVLPFERLLSLSTSLVSMLLGVRDVKEEDITEEDLAILAKQATEQGFLLEEELEIVQRVFHLDDWHASVFMTPRSEITYLDVTDPDQELVAVVKSGRRSAYPVVKGSLDEVLGVASTKHLLSQILQDGNLDVQSTLIEPLIVPENIHILDLLQQFQESGLPLALLINEFGGTEGIVTQHDLLEVMVGDLIDFDQQRIPSVVQRTDGSYLFDGQLPLERVAEMLETPLGEPGANYRTLGGFIMAQLGAIPTEADAFTRSGYRFEVVDMDGRRIDKVLVSRVEGS